MVCGRCAIMAVAAAAATTWQQPMTAAAVPAIFFKRLTAAIIVLGKTMPKANIYSAMGSNTDKILKCPSKPRLSMKIAARANNKFPPRRRAFSYRCNHLLLNPPIMKHPDVKRKK